MLKKIKIKKSFLLTVGALCLFTLIGFVDKTQSEKIVKRVLVTIDHQHDNYFIDEKEAMMLLTLNDQKSVIGERYQDINLKTLESRIKTHKFAEDVQVYKDLKGNLMVDIKQCRPIARIIQPAGPHAYIGSNGNVLPVSEKFTARVVLISGDRAFRRLTDSAYMHSEEGIGFMNILNTIDKDSFWKAQIVQIAMDNSGELTFYPQVGDEALEFGKPEDVEAKFKKLKIFYKKIQPAKGFNKYNLVSVKYKDQIICE